jgi:hypothetical protein
MFCARPGNSGAPWQLLAALATLAILATPWRPWRPYMIGSPLASFDIPFEKNSKTRLTMDLSMLIAMEYE